MCPSIVFRWVFKPSNRLVYPIFLVSAGWLEPPQDVLQSDCLFAIGSAAWTRDQIIFGGCPNRIETCTVMAQNTNYKWLYNWLFLWDYTFHQWGL
jgi:hypothetical protein